MEECQCLPDIVDCKRDTVDSSHTRRPCANGYSLSKKIGENCAKRKMAGEHPLEGQRLKSFQYVGISKLIPARQEFGGNCSLAGENQIRHLTHHYAEEKGRNPDPRWPLQDIPQYKAELPHCHRFGSRGVHRTVNSRCLENVHDRSHHIVTMDPGKPLQP
jgi:hypothetical protein